MRLGTILAAWRKADGVSVRRAAKLIGVPQATLNRIERGYECDSQTLAKLLGWLLER